jgi:hypothetical protein
MPAVSCVRAKPNCGPGLDWADADVPASSKLQAIKNAVLHPVKLQTGLEEERKVAEKKVIMVGLGKQSRPQG